jgi:hypothetical protein
VANPAAPRKVSAPAVWVGLILVALFASTALLGRPATFPESGAAAWLPPDGTRQRYAGPDGTVATEWALDQAVSLIGSGPPQFYSWLAETSLDWQTAAVARVVSVFESSTGKYQGREDDLYSVGADGVRTEAEVASNGISRIYLPGRLDVAATMAAGAAWTSSGTVVETTLAGEERLQYTVDYAARTPAEPTLIPRGCVVVNMRERVGTRPEATSERTWCRHAGVISYASTDGAWRGSGARVETSPEPDQGLDWSRAEELQFTPRTINQVGVGATLVSPVSPPGMLPDGTIVFNNQVFSDVLALDPATDPPPVTWRARPGGRNTALAVFGDTTIAAATGRELVAYGPGGQWLWEHRLSDLAVVTPARLGDLVVVATLDGRVTAYELGTGSRRWSYTSSAEIRVAPVVAADHVLVVDQAGQLTCLDASGAEVWTTDAGRVEHFGVWTGPPAAAPSGPVVVVPRSDGSRVQGLSLADGSRLWRVREFADAKDVLALDDVVVLRDADEAVGLDPTTGTRLWSWHGARTYTGTGGGDRVLLLAADRLVLLDERGGVRREWPMSVGDVTSAATYLVPARGRLLVYGPGGVQLGVLP